MGDSKVKNENMILDFTHVYRDEDIKDIDRFRYIDCSDIQETDMYCSKMRMKNMGQDRAVRNSGYTLYRFGKLSLYNEDYNRSYNRTVWAGYV